jgi:hypothetical protein
MVDGEVEDGFVLDAGDEDQSDASSEILFESDMED